MKKTQKPLANAAGRLPKASLQDKAKEWADFQEKNPRPGSSNVEPPLKAYIPKGVTLHPVVKMVSPKDLKFNPLNDFDRLPQEEYENLKADIRLNGVLDALTVKKDHVIVTGENRLRIALELIEEGVEKVKFIPVRYYMNELSREEEYDILEGDNLFRRHLTPEQKKERLKARIKRKYKDELEQDNRGGDRKSEKTGQADTTENSNREVSQKLAGHSSDLKDSGSKVSPQPLIGKMNLAKVISESENIPVGTAKVYLAEIKKELKPKAQSRQESSVLSEEERTKAEGLANEIRVMELQIQGLKEEIKKLEDLKKKKLKELKTIGQPELFGIS